MTEFLEAVLRGLGTGSIYALLALGFVIIYKSTGVISFAQPALMLAGATITSYVAPAIGIVAFAGFSFFVSSSSRRCCTAAAIALLIERTAIRPMVGQAGLRGRDHHHRHRHRGPGRGQRLHRARRPADPQPVGPGARRASPGCGSRSGTCVLDGRARGDRGRAVRLLPLHPLRPGDAGGRVRPGGRADPGRQRRQRVRAVVGAWPARWPRSPAACSPSAAGVDRQIWIVALVALPGDHPRRPRLPARAR